MAIFGSPWERLRQALDQGNLTAARTAAADVPDVPLSEALELVVLVSQNDRDRLPRFALAWHGRFVRELRDVRPEEAQAVLALLIMLSGPRQRQAARALACLIGDRRALDNAAKALLRIADSY